MADAAYDYALILHEGDGVDVDDEKALEYFQKAKGLGSKDADGYIAQLSANAPRD